MRFSVLASGSEGNCVFVEDSEGQGVLVDAGISMSRISCCLTNFGSDFSRIKAVLISHEHSDHLRGAAVLARRKDLPIYASDGTIALVKRHLPEYTRFFGLNGNILQFGNLQIESFPVMHDASQTVGFVVTENHCRLGIATDLGHVDKVTLEHLRQCDAIILEANHDLGMLIEGSYPWELKRRIKSPKGHLSNDQAAEALGQIAGSRLKRVVLAHLSKENNRPEMALTSVRSKLNLPDCSHIDVIVAEQKNPTGIFDL